MNRAKVSRRFLIWMIAIMISGGNVFGQNVPSISPIVLDSAAKLPKECGRSVGSLILGAEPRVFDFPWMALLRYNNGGEYVNGCEGSLISKRYVLSAAYCIQPRNSWQLEYVRLGEYNRTSEIDCTLRTPDEDPECADPAVEYKVESFVIHKEYNQPKYSNDIGLVRLDKDVKFQHHIRPICLPVTPELQGRDNDVYVVTGWETTKTRKGFDVMKMAVMTRMSNEKCQDKFTDYRITIQQSYKQICIPGKDFYGNCWGLSGGPLASVTDFNGPRYVLYGVASASFNKCDNRSVLETTPAIYTQVASYMDWILENIED